MRREGHFRQVVFFRRNAEVDPQWLDSYEYAILGEEYRAALGRSRR